MAEEKSEAATPRKRSDARKKGQVSKSQELSSIVVLLGIIMFLGGIVTHASGLLREYFSHIFLHLDNTQLTTPLAMKAAGELFVVFMRAIAPLLAVALTLGVLVNVAQTGFLWSPEALTPNLAKLNPLTGIGRLFQPRSLVELVKSFYKIMIIGWIAYGVINGAYPQLMTLSQMDLSQGIGFIGELVMKMALRVAATMLILAAGDYFFQRWQFEKSIRMTKQEVKQESKQMETDPQIKQRIRQRQREASRKRMMQDVPLSSVIITNPTHFAVALKYDPERSHAPILVAKGADLIALRIREIGKENDVPLVENPPLARALFKQVEIGHEIPGELYEAVAEVLAYVFRLDEERRQRMATAYGL